MAAPPSVGSTSKLEASSEQPSATKKAKKSKKGKERATDQNLGDDEMQLEAEEADDSANSNFKLVQNTMRLPLAPIFAEDPLEGVRQCLESWILRSIRATDCIHSRLS